MINLIFQLGSEIILIKIVGTQVTFGNTTYGAQMAPISGLKLNKEGVIKEFPHLKDIPVWKEEAIRLFKEKINKFPSEKARAEYIIDDLKKHGYKIKQWQKNGERPIKL